MLTVAANTPASVGTPEMEPQPLAGGVYELIGDPQTGPAAYIGEREIAHLCNAHRGRGERGVEQGGRRTGRGHMERDRIDVRLPHTPHQKG